MWDAIAGHENSKAFLAELFQEKRPRTSLLLLGPEGCGKKMLALAFARDFLCLQERRADCRCVSCGAFAVGSHPDFLLVAPSAPGKEILLEQIKTMAAQAAFAPTLSTYKVCVIDGADYLNAAAANSLLKLLEEPPAYWLFILLAAEESRILLTIRSRVVQLKSEGLPPELIEKILRERGFADEAPVLARLAEGSAGHALKMADENVLAMRNIVQSIFLALPEKEASLLPQRFPWPDKASGQDGRELLKIMLFILRDAVFVKVGLDKYVYNIDMSSWLKNNLAGWQLSTIRNIIKKTEESYRAVATNVSGKIVWEALLLSVNRILKEEKIYADSCRNQV